MTYIILVHHAPYSHHSVARPQSLPVFLFAGDLRGRAFSCQKLFFGILGALELVPFAIFERVSVFGFCYMQ